jgi:hypothetical protein
MGNNQFYLGDKNKVVGIEIMAEVCEVAGNIDWVFA